MHYASTAFSFDYQPTERMAPEEASIRRRTDAATVYLGEEPPLRCNAAMLAVQDDALAPPPSLRGTSVIRGELGE